MNYNILRPFRSAKKLLFKKNASGKNLALIIWPENTNFFNMYNSLNIQRQYVRHYFLPMFQKPFRTRLTPPLRKAIRSYKIFPTQGKLSNFSEEMDNKNFFLDMSAPLIAFEEKFNISRYNTGRGRIMLDAMINSTENVSSEKFEKILIYGVNTDKEMGATIRARRAFIFFAMFTAFHEGKRKTLPFDKFFLYLYNSEGGKYILLYDKRFKIQIARVKTILRKISSDIQSVDDDVEEQVEDSATPTLDHVKNLISGEKNVDPKSPSLEKEDKKKSLELDKTKNLIKTYVSNIPRDERKNLDPKDLLTGSIVYNLTGDIDKAKKAVATLSPEKKNVVIKKYKEIPLVKQKGKSHSNNILIKGVDPAELNDNQVPHHIFEKRKKDFSEHILQDMAETFKMLESKEIPLKLKNIKLEERISPDGVINKTYTDRYVITLEDHNGVEQQLHVDFPHLTENGTFLHAGNEYVITNQIIPYPIFFLKPYLGRFESSYSAISVRSKILKNTSYLMLRIAGPDVPLIMFFAYRYGFKEALSMFNVTYNISDEKNSPDDMKLPNGKFISFNFKEDDEVARQVVESFRYSIIHANEKFNVETKDSWQWLLERYTSNRNCTYNMNLSWDNIVTPIEKNILEAKGDPTNIKDIIMYIASKVVDGYVDDRNDVGKLRIRTSELFIAQMQKLVNAAYNDYLSKTLGGDPEAKLYINPTTVASAIINSENVNPLENINPIEELSSFLRISPVGIGGISDSRAFPDSARGIHPSYYGNVDPLESPDSEKIGIQQHLTVGSNISNVRGMFIVKDRDKVKPSEILGLGPALIPFVETNDGNRVTMAAANLKQAIPTKNAEQPAVQTGYESLVTDLLSDKFIKKSPSAGKVVAIEDIGITIEDKSGKQHFIKTTPESLYSGSGKPGLSTFKPRVKIGQSVSEGQILAEGANLIDGVISNGINVLASFIPWNGFNFEDGMVISESMAKRFVSLHMENSKTIVSPEEDIAYMAKVGDSVQKGSILLTYSSAIYDVEANKHLRSEGGKVVQIEIYSNVPEEDIPETIREQYEEFKNFYTLETGNYPIGKFKEKDSAEKIEGIMIKFTIQQELELEKGDKINNRHFNKGVISKIVPDDEMPKAPWGQTIDIVYSPLSVVNRMNSGQLSEMYLGLISKKLSESIQSDTRKTFEKDLKNVLNILDRTENKKYTKRVLGTIQSLSEAGYKKLVADIKESGFLPMIVPPFKSPKYGEIMEALKYMGLKPKYPVTVSGKKLVGEVPVGYMYVQKLEHLSDKKIHARGTGPYSGAHYSPTQGKRRDGAQKFGEGDLYTLLSWNTPVTIEEFMGPLAADHMTKNEMISEIYKSGEASFKLSTTNSVKDQFDQSFYAIHLDLSEDYEQTK